ncbi:MAG: hypothetical protein KF760_02250 [Candidatus Eremiobacteraeota bacterium]|nr:hypothetical protein [Candidatus Eremiobacteraeota bacterium]
MLRCLGADCEGWELTPEDRFCPNCGQGQFPVQLIPLDGQGRKTNVLSLGKAGLAVTYLGRSGLLEPGSLRLPAWLRADSEFLPLDPGQTVRLDLSVLDTAEEGLPGVIQLGEAEVAVWSSPPARAQLEWRTELLNPEQGWIAGHLRVLSGALYVDQLPAGWECAETLPLVLSQRARPALHLKAPAVTGPVQWQLGELLLRSQLECRWAGHLEMPERLEWCLTSQPRLEVPLRTWQGGVEIERVESSIPGLLAHFPAALEGAGGLELEGEAEPGLSWVEVVLRDGRRRRLLLDVVKPDRTDYAGWLLIDLGSTTTTAALLDEQGRLTQLALDGESLCLPSGLAYFSEGDPQPTEQAGPNVALEAKRHLGLPDFRFRLILPSQEILERTPEEVLGDYLEVLWQRVGRTPALARQRLRRCCLAHPAAFSPRQIHLLRQAFLSRLDCRLELICEPLAAAYEFLAGRAWPEREWRLLLYDFGGTTSDVAWLTVDSRRSTMVSVELEHVGGDRWFGGNDITAFYAAHLEEQGGAGGRRQSPPEHEEAERLKREHSLRSVIDPLVEPRLRLSLPEGPVPPDLIVVSGLGSLYPLIPEWLQRCFPGVPLERAAEPKHCVVLGARYHPEVVRSGPPRSLAPGSSWLAFPEQTGATVCTTRLGVKLMGERGARFHPLIQLGQSLPGTAELTPVSLLPGQNWLEVVENLGWENDYVLPDGSLNGQLVTLERLSLRVSEDLDPAHTVLRWALSADYRLLVRVECAGRNLLEVGPFRLWPEYPGPRWRSSI